MKVLLAAKSNEALQATRASLESSAARPAIATAVGPLGQLGQALAGQAPDVLVLVGFGQDTEELAGIEALLARGSAPATLLLCPDPTAELLLAAMRAGVREVLPSPVTPGALDEALERAAQRGSSGPPVTGKGQVFAFLGCKGGAGATFLATNLGFALALNRPVKVALLDLNLQAGDAALHVSDRTPAVTLADVARDIARLDASYLAASLVPVLPNYGVLAAPGSPERALDVQPAHVGALLDLAVQLYDYVLVDASRVLDATVVQALDRATRIFAVLQLTVPAVRDARRLLATFDALGYERGHIQLVVNRFERNEDLGIKDVERTLGMPVAWTLPNSFRTVTSSVNQGVPVVKLAPRDPVSKALLAMAASVGKARKGGERWVRDLLHIA